MRIIKILVVVLGALFLLGADALARTPTETRESTERGQRTVREKSEQDTGIREGRVHPVTKKEYVAPRPRPSFRTQGPHERPRDRFDGHFDTWHSGH
jgi:hypothetical protein